MALSEAQIARLNAPGSRDRRGRFTASQNAEAETDIQETNAQLLGVAARWPDLPAETISRISEQIGGHRPSFLREVAEAFGVSMSCVHDITEHARTHAPTANNYPKCTDPTLILEIEASGITFDKAMATELGLKVETPAGAILITLHEDGELTFPSHEHLISEASKSSLGDWRDITATLSDRFVLESTFGAQCKEGALTFKFNEALGSSHITWADTNGHSIEINVLKNGGLNMSFDPSCDKAIAQDMGLNYSKWSQGEEAKLIELARATHEQALWNPLVADRRREHRGGLRDNAEFRNACRELEQAFETDAEGLLDDLTTSGGTVRVQTRASGVDYAIWVDPKSAKKLLVDGYETPKFPTRARKAKWLLDLVNINQESMKQIALGSQRGLNRWR